MFIYVVLREEPTFNSQKTNKKVNINTMWNTW